MMNWRFYIQYLSAFLIVLTCFTMLNGQDVRDESGIDPPDFNRVGQTGWQFLHLPTTARNAALADIKTGLTHNNVTAIFNNPANLVDVENMDFMATNISYVADISYLTAAFAKNFGQWGNLGVFVASLDIGDMVRTENVYNTDLGITERSGNLGTFTAGDLMIGLSYARWVTNSLAIGGNISYIEERLDDVKVDNWNMDFGLYYATGFNSLRLSMVARNFGPDTEFTGFSEIYGLPQSVRMPVNFRFGVGYDFIESTDNSSHRLTTLLEGVHPNDGPERIHTAVEYSYMNIFNLRGGYRFNYDEQGLTFGGGLNYTMGNINGRIDYAYLDYGRLTEVHLFTLGFGLQ